MIWTSLPSTWPARPGCPSHRWTSGRISDMKTISRWGITEMSTSERYSQPVLVKPPQHQRETKRPYISKSYVRSTQFWQSVRPCYCMPASFVIRQIFTA
eukprot:scaffold173496_cov35-Prasinocladus_malaysianus.AAC.1